MTPLLLKLIFTAIPGRVPFLARGVAKGISKAMNANMIDPQLKAHTAYWEAELTKSEWFAGDAFSAADIMMSFPVEAAGSRVALWPGQAEAEGLPAEDSRATGVSAGARAGRAVQLRLSLRRLGLAPAPQSPGTRRRNR
jgi:glutathione S-transferase